MKYLTNHLRDDLSALIQRDYAIVPEIVVQGSTNVDEIELMITILVGKGYHNALITVTDDCRVISDCVDIVEFSGRLVPVSIDREIQQGA